MKALEACPETDSLERDHNRAPLPTERPRWKDLIFDVLDINERIEYQVEATGDPSLPVTHENNPSLHARLCRELKNEYGHGDFLPFTFDGASWTPYVRVQPIEVASVDFGMLDEFASAVERLEAQNERKRSSIHNTDARQNTAKTPVKRPVKKSTRKR
jgi:hypothetical protein